MAPRLALHRSLGLAFRPKRGNLPVKPSFSQAPARRHITADEKPLPTAEKGQGPGPNEAQLPHVSEEAAATAKITGEAGPDIEQGTPVQEILQRDDKLKENAPKVLQDDVQKASPNGTRSFSTSARRKALEMAPIEGAETDTLSLTEPGFSALMDGRNSIEQEGHLFGLPEMPMPRNMHLRRRDDTMIGQLTRLIMRDGKLSKAQSTVAMILERLRTAKPPTANSKTPLLPGSPPVSHLPLNPVLYVTLAIDSVAPLLRMKALKGQAGGGQALMIPLPINQRQRRRTAIMWILDAASKKRSTGSGRAMFANKIADEIIAIVDGRSGIWEKRGMIHKLSVAARANLATVNRQRLRR